MAKYNIYGLRESNNIKFLPIKANISMTDHPTSWESSLTLDRLASWARTNCKGQWRISAGVYWPNWSYPSSLSTEGSTIMAKGEFELESDALIFKLSV